MKVLSKMHQIGVIPVFYNADADTAEKIVKACAEGGAMVVEMTNRGDNAVEVFKKLEQYCIDQHPEIILGAGSVVDPYTAAQYINSGANFIVGPTLDRETAFLCNRRKVPYSPGCGSVNEIQAAHELGVEIVKVFPGGQVGGPAFVKAVRGPMPWTSIMPTGGVSPTKESLTEWFSADISCAGIGSKLITKDLVTSGNFDGLTAHIRNTVELIKEIRK
jgi:2-dehydro-3-deoxyphosphogluconate aldolase/(4S)-4-hydroxy-2-oxoglutarate aldolase